MTDSRITTTMRGAPQRASHGRTMLIRLAPVVALALALLATLSRPARALGQKLDSDSDGMPDA